MGTVAAFVLVAALGIAGAARRPIQPGTTRTAVVVELFTSEGCSSCPPADTVLRRLVAEQPIEGVEVIALGSHVDYWDRLGWRDPFSSALFSQRQSSYDAAVFRSDRIYTPQLVVDGRLECLASDEGAVRRAIRAAARQAKGILSVSAALASDASAQVDVRVQMPAGMSKHDADVVIAVTEDGLVTRVERGENGGRSLSHSAVVRTMTTAGRIGAKEDTTSTTTRVPLDRSWNPSTLKMVAFVQERTSRRILAAGASTLTSDRSQH